MPSCWQSWDRDFFTRSAVRRAPPLAYQHSLMIFAITRRACGQEETDAITGIIIMLYTFPNLLLHLLHTCTERMTAKTTELYQPYIAVTNHWIIWHWWKSGNLCVRPYELKQCKSWCPVLDLLTEQVKKTHKTVFALMSWQFESDSMWTVQSPYWVYNWLPHWAASHFFNSNWTGNCYYDDNFEIYISLCTVVEMTACN